MYKLTTEHSFDAAHFLKGHEGKCKNIHGHRWRVIVTVCGETLQTEGSEKGMLLDFSVLKKDVKEMVDALDHALIIEDGSLKSSTVDVLSEEGFYIITVPFRPTAEHFSKYFYELMVNKGYDVDEVVVYETPNNCASYTEGK